MQLRALALVTLLLGVAVFASAQAPSDFLVQELRREAQANAAIADVEPARVFAVETGLFGVYTLEETRVAGDFVSFTRTERGIRDYTVGRHVVFTSIEYDGETEAIFSTTGFAQVGAVVAAHPDNSLGLILIHGPPGAAIDFTPAQRAEVQPDAVIIRARDHRGVFFPADPEFQYLRGGALRVTVPDTGLLAFYVANSPHPARGALTEALPLLEAGRYGAIHFASRAETGLLTQTIPFGAGVALMDVQEDRLTAVLTNPSDEPRLVDLFFPAAFLPVTALEELNVTRQGQILPRAGSPAAVFEGGGADAFAQVNPDFVRVTILAEPGQTTYGIVADPAEAVDLAGEWIAFRDRGVVREQPPVYEDPGWWWMVGMFASIALLGFAIVWVNRFYKP